MHAHMAKDSTKQRLREKIPTKEQYPKSIPSTLHLVSVCLKKGTHNVWNLDTAFIRFSLSCYIHNEKEYLGKTRVRRLLRTSEQMISSWRSLSCLSLKFRGRYAADKQGLRPRLLIANALVVNSSQFASIRLNRIVLVLTNTLAIWANFGN